MFPFNKFIHGFQAVSVAWGLLLLVGCANVPLSYDFSAFRAHMPRSILVLPPTNDSVEVLAPYTYLSTVSRPLAEAGYYVFPVVVVDQLFKENGLPTPYEMHEVSLDKIDEVLGADAVLYIHISEFGQKYAVLSSNTTVKAQATLVDVRTGQELWVGSAHAVEQSGDGGGGLLGMVIASAVEQVLDSMTDRVVDVARVANRQMFSHRTRGVLLGPLRPDHEVDARGR